MVAHVLIAVGDHGSSPVPALYSPTMWTSATRNAFQSARSTQVEILFPVLNGKVDRMPTSIEVRADRVHRPVAVLVTDIATVTCASTRVRRGSSGQGSG